MLPVNNELVITPAFFYFFFIFVDQGAEGPRKLVVPLPGYRPASIFPEDSQHFFFMACEATKIVMLFKLAVWSNHQLLYSLFFFPKLGTCPYSAHTCAQQL